MKYEDDDDFPVMPEIFTFDDVRVTLTWQPAVNDLRAEVSRPGWTIGFPFYDGRSLLRTYSMREIAESCSVLREVGE